jgi:hypothetical protein
MSYSELQHQRDLLVLRPVNSVTAVDLKQAAGTALAVFNAPKAWYPLKLVKMGGNIITAGGAVTIAGKAKLQIAGTDLDDDGSTVLTLDWAGANAAAHSNIEKDLDTETGDFGPVTYEEVTDGQKIEMLVHTEGTGAGAQSFHPYLIIRISP